MERLEQEWPALSAQLYRLLAKRGVPAWVAEDIVQETATRLIGSWDKIDPERRLGPYACTIALNLLTDHYRRLAQADVRSELPDVAAKVDVPHEVMVRLEMQEVASALKRISTRQREALLADITGEQTEVIPPPMRMLRLRARRALTRLVDRSAAVGAGLAFRFRRLEDLAKTYLPQVSVAVNAQLFFGWSTQAALAGVATIGLLAGPGVNAAPARVGSQQIRNEIAFVARDRAVSASESIQLRRASVGSNRRGDDAPAPLIDDLGHKARTQRGYSFDIPGAATAGHVTVETLAKVTVPDDPTAMLRDKPSCSLATSKNSASVECLHQGSLMYGVRLSNQNETALKRIQ